MVNTSMLPGSGTSELSASPNSNRPGPPRCRSQIHSFDTRKIPTVLVMGRPAGVAVANGLASPLRGREFCDLQEMERRCRRQGSTFGGVTIKQLQAFQATRVQLVVNVLPQV